MGAQSRYSREYRLHGSSCLLGLNTKRTGAKYSETSRRNLGHSLALPTVATLGDPKPPAPVLKMLPFIGKEYLGRA